MPKLLKWPSGLFYLFIFLPLYKLAMFTGGCLEWLGQAIQAWAQACAELTEK